MANETVPSSDTDAPGSCFSSPWRSPLSPGVPPSRAERQGAILQTSANATLDQTKMFAQQLARSIAATASGRARRMPPADARKTGANAVIPRLGGALVSIPPRVSARTARKHTGVRAEAARTTRVFRACMPGIARWHRQGTSRWLSTPWSRRRNPRGRFVIDDDDHGDSRGRPLVACAAARAGRRRIPGASSMQGCRSLSWRRQGRELRLGAGALHRASVVSLAGPTPASLGSISPFTRLESHSTGCAAVRVVAHGVCYRAVESRALS